MYVNNLYGLLCLHINIIYKLKKYDIISLTEIEEKMKRNEYKLYSSKVKSDKNIAIVSDLHISESMSDSALTEVLDTLDDINPSHIVIPGDLYNVDISTICEDKVTKFVNEASLIADVFYVKGNIEDKGSILNMRILPTGLSKNNNPKIHILCEKIGDYQERFVHYDGINISGIRMPESFYKLSEYEKVTMLLSKYQRYLERLSKQCGESNFNVLLCHDPIIRDMLMVMETIKNEPLNFDLVISGHNHGGMFPESLKPLFKLISKDIKKYYPSYTDGIMTCDNNSIMIVSEGVTKYHSEMGVLEHLERFHEGTVENVRVLKKN